MRSLLCLLWSLLSAAGGSSPADRTTIEQPFSAPSSKRLSNRAALLTLHGPLDWFPSDAVHDLEVTLSSQAKQGRDFFLWKSSYSLPKQKSSPLFLQLQPGKEWIPGLTEDVSEALYIKKIVYRNNDFNSGHVSHFSPVFLATVFNNNGVCPPSIELPGASSRLQELIRKTLTECQDPLFVKSKDLPKCRHTSQDLLQMQPSIFFIDGRDQNFELAGLAVDEFLAKHSVLTIAWEPTNAKEPLYWILIPHPSGMPGHLFLLIDNLQWNHPNIVDDLKRFRQLVESVPPLAETTLHSTPHFCAFSPHSTPDEYVCPLGCPRANLVGSTASGFGADAYNIYSKLRDGILYDIPVQAFPTVLGKRLFPPLWGGHHGWTYTYGACDSNFLDCFFLKHSPCPPISLDIRELNQSELDMFSFKNERLNIRDGGKVGFELNGWDDLVGSGSADIPLRSIQDLWPSALPSRHVFYSYIFRPKLNLRQSVYERILNFDKDWLQSSNSNLKSSPCAMFHVRRGDILFHPNQARYYLPLQAYIRASKVHLDTFNIRNIYLFTDSATVINEARECATNFPDICADLTFHFVNKKRWRGGEGGWENPFPSRNSTEELLNLQLELSLSQRCDLAVTGESEFGELLYQHMCCGFPISERGKLPHRCLCPPRVKLLQSGFSCDKGNTLLCGTDEELERLLINDGDDKGKKFSSSAKAYKLSTTVNIQPKIGGETKSFLLEEVENKGIQYFLEKSAKKSKEVLCQSYDSGPDRSAVCLGASD